MGLRRVGRRVRVGEGGGSLRILGSENRSNNDNSNVNYHLHVLSILDAADLECSIYKKQYTTKHHPSPTSPFPSHHSFLTSSLQLLFLTISFFIFTFPLSQPPIGLTVGDIYLSLLCYRHFSYGPTYFGCKGQSGLLGRCSGVIHSNFLRSSSSLRASAGVVESISSCWTRNQGAVEMAREGVLGTNKASGAARRVLGILSSRGPSLASTSESGDPTSEAMLMRTASESQWPDDDLIGLRPGRPFELSKTKFASISRTSTSALSIGGVGIRMTPGGTKTGGTGMEARDSLALVLLSRGCWLRQGREVESDFAS